MNITKTWTQKYYRAGFTYNGLGRMSRRKFRTATEAARYALRTRMRVDRLRFLAAAEKVGQMAGEQ